MHDLTHEHWWEAPKGTAHNKVIEAVTSLEQRQSGARTSMQRHLGLYLDREINDFSSVIKARSQPLFGESKNLNLNVVKSCIDTVSAKLVSHRPRPMFMTSDGMHEDRKMAKGLERWVDGLFYREELYTKHAPHAFLDGGIFGTGAIKIFPDNGEVRLEWCWIGQLIVDEAASLFASPRVLYQRQFVSRDVLMAQYPKHKDEIKGLDGDTTTADTPHQTEDVIEVIEAWHLASGPGAKDGKHTICVSNATLFEEKYTDPDFPFAFFRWGRSPLGFYGLGLSEELHGIQIEIKNLLSRIQEAMQLTAQVVILKPRGTKIPDEHFSNKNGVIIEFDGAQPPRWETPASMNSQVFDHVWKLRDAAYEIAGISQLSASGTKPAGIESGVALRTLNDFETQRFALLGRDWEEFILDVARKAIIVARRTYKGGGGKMKWASRDAVKDIQWKDVNLKEDAYVLRMYPTNMLPQTPAGRLATVNELMSTEMITPEEGRSLLDFPDLDKLSNLKNAMREDFYYIFDEIMTDQNYIPPMPEMDLELGVQIAQTYWVKAHKDKAPEEIRDLFVQWMVDAKDILMPPKDPMASMPPGPEGMPPGPEGMPPGPEGMMPPGGPMPGPPEGGPPPGLDGPPPMAVGASPQKQQRKY